MYNGVSRDMSVISQEFLKFVVKFQKDLIKDEAFPCLTEFLSF